MEGSMLVRKLMIVGTVALLFRFLFILWGMTGWSLLEQNPISNVYFLQGYGICADYGYVHGGRGRGYLYNLKKMVDQGQRITPQSAPVVDSSAFVPETLHPPGMSMLVAAVHWLTGSGADIYIEILGMILDIAAACILCWMVASFFSVRVAFAVGLVYALYPPLAYACTLDRSPEGLMSVFIVGSLACVLLSTRNPTWKGILWWIAAGLLVGLGAYLRPDYLLVPAAFGFSLWLYTRRFWRSMLAGMVMLAIAIALLTPWAYRNHQIFGRWIFTSTAMNVTLYGSLGQFNNPWGIKGPDKYRGMEAKKQGFVSAFYPPEVDLYFQKLFWDAVKSKPWGYAASVAKRLPLAIFSPQTFGFKNPSKTTRFDEESERGKDRYDVVLSKPVYIVKAYWEWLLMGVIGLAGFLSSLFMLICERNRFGLVLLLLSPHLYSIGMHTLIRYEPRYMLPSMFSFLIGLAYVLSRGWQDRNESIVPRAVTGPCCAPSGFTAN
jgi:hypothetical protein